MALFCETVSPVAGAAALLIDASVLEEVPALELADAPAVSGASWAEEAAFEVVTGSIAVSGAAAGVIAADTTAGAARLPSVMLKLGSKRLKSKTSTCPL